MTKRKVCLVPFFLLALSGGSRPLLKTSRQSLLCPSFWKSSTPASSTSEAQGSSNHPRYTWLATCHAWSCHPLCANLARETPIGEMPGEFIGQLPRGPGLSFLVDPCTALARCGSEGTCIPPPSPHPWPPASQEVKFSLDKSIICKWCQNIPPFSLATFPEVSICLLIPSSPLISLYHLFPLLGMAAGSGEQSCFSRLRQTPVPHVVVVQHHGQWLQGPSLPESRWLILGSRWAVVGPVTGPASCIWQPHASVSGGLALLDNSLCSLRSLSERSVPCGHSGI